VEEKQKEDENDDEDEEEQEEEGGDAREDVRHTLFKASFEGTLSGALQKSASRAALPDEAAELDELKSQMKEHLAAGSSGKGEAAGGSRGVHGDPCRKGGVAGGLSR